MLHAGLARRPDVAEQIGIGRGYARPIPISYLLYHLRSGMPDETVTRHIFLLLKKHESAE